MQNDEFRCGLCVSRGSVWPRIHGAFSARRGVRYRRGPALFVTTCEFHGVPFGPVPTRLFRYSLRLVIVWLFRCCERPNGMEVGFSLLSLWQAVSEAPPPFRLVVRGDGGSPGWGRTSGVGCGSRGRAGQTESGTRKGTWCRKCVNR